MIWHLPHINQAATQNKKTYPFIFFIHKNYNLYNKSIPRFPIYPLTIYLISNNINFTVRHIRTGSINLFIVKKNKINKNNHDTLKSCCEPSSYQCTSHVVTCIVHELKTVRNSVIMIYIKQSENFVLSFG